jgi:predicted acylesterase/phospholipase RssA
MAATREGPIVAVDVMARGLPRSLRSDTGRADTPRGRRESTATLPTIVETLGRSMTLASRRAADAERSLAAAVVTPRLEDIGLLDFARIDHIVREGYRAAEDVLAAGTLG